MSKCQIQIISIYRLLNIIISTYISIQRFKKLIHLLNIHEIINLNFNKTLKFKDCHVNMQSCMY